MEIKYKCNTLCITFNPSVLLRSKCVMMFKDHFKVKIAQILNYMLKRGSFITPSKTCISELKLKNTRHVISHPQAHKANL